MSELKSTLRRARLEASRLREGRGSVRARLSELEAAVQENRKLNRRVAELTDLVAELLVPLARRDDEKVDALLARYRDSI
jgi:t-SNARE complex subunit (syntaxin)